MNEIAKTIKEVRQKNGLSQKDFAKSLTVGQPYISRIEHSKEHPTPMFIKLFCLLYSVDEKILKD